MSKVRGGRVTFDPDRIVMGGGATGANEILMFCLADPGDAFLVPTPYYPAYVDTFHTINMIFYSFIIIWCCLVIRKPAIPKNHLKLLSDIYGTFYILLHIFSFYVLANILSID